MHFQVIINSFSGFGPYCLCFKDNEPSTVYDLKQKLANTTAFRVEEQSIRSLGGRILTDSFDLFEDYLTKDGPLVLNLTVRLIGGRHETMKQMPATENVEPFMKKIRLNNDAMCVPVQEEARRQQLNKGKEKESRKRRRE